MIFQDFFAFVKEFFVDEQFLYLFTSTIFLFLVCWLAWYVYYKQLARKDLFEIPKMHPDRKWATRLNNLLYFLKYLVIFPFYSFIWFLLFSFLLSVLSSSRPIENLLFLSIIVVAATRISAYVSSNLAEDMGKLLPWTLIAIFLLDPSSVTLEKIVFSFNVLLEQVPKVIKYLVFIIVLEWILRLGNWIINPFSKLRPK